jgi:anti-sigma-28 factor FlgM
MRIQDTQPNVHSSLAKGVESTRPSDAKASSATPARARTVDEVHMSPDVQLASSAIAVAKNSPDIRSDVVARAEKLMAAGAVGADSGRLADTLIDAALNDAALHL